MLVFSVNFIFLPYRISSRCSEVCSSGSGGVTNDLSYAGPRMPNILKSESSDRGKSKTVIIEIRILLTFYHFLDDSIRSTLMTTHQQMTNYSLYLKKRARQESNKSSLGPMDEEQAMPLVTLHGSRANMRPRTSSMSASEGQNVIASSTSVAGEASLEGHRSTGSGLGGVAETSFMPMQVMVIEPPMPSHKSGAESSDFV